MPVDFLTVGHMTQDRVAGGFRPGGTVSYASVTALRLGRQPAILTRGCAPGLLSGKTQSISAAASGPGYEALDGITVHQLPSLVDTVFDNIYREDGERIQVVESVADSILPGDLPEDWAQPALVLLGPVAREIPTSWSAVCPDALLGMTAQGCLRQWDTAGHVTPARWPDPEPFLRRADVVVLSREDVRGDQAYISDLAAKARLLVVTDGRNGCTVYRSGVGEPVQARRAREVDPTGAGDVFTCAFLIRLAETGDPLQAARFGNVVASMSVEAPGMGGIPWRSQVDLELVR